MSKQPFRIHLLSSAYIFTVFFLVSLGLAYIQGAINNLYSDSTMGINIQSLSVPILLLLLIGLLKVYLMHHSYNINLLDYIHYFGVYKIISQIIMIPSAIMLYFQYSNTYYESVGSQVFLYIFNILFDIVLGIVIIIWSYLRYRRIEILHKKEVL